MLSESMLSESVLSESMRNESMLSEFMLSECMVNESMVSESMLSESRLSESKVSASMLSESMLNELGGGAGAGDVGIVERKQETHLGCGESDAPRLVTSLKEQPGGPSSPSRGYSSINHDSTMKATPAACSWLSALADFGWDTSRPNTEKPAQPPHLDHTFHPDHPTNAPEPTGSEHQLAQKKSVVRLLRPPPIRAAPLT